MNTYRAQIKVGSGLQYVEQEATNWSHAKQLLEMKYGKENVQNVTQIR
jgi:hypothetical protein